MRNYDILFLDMDGTVLNSQNQASERTRKALKAAQDAGEKLVVATGRTLKIVPDLVHELNFDYAAVSNGASIYDLRTGDRVYHHDFNLEAARVMCDVLVEECDFIEFYANGGITVAQSSYERIGKRPIPPWHLKFFAENDTKIWESEAAFVAAGAPGLEKVALVNYDERVLDRIRSRLAPTGLFNITASIAGALEINDKSCSKGVALRDICQRMGIDIARSAAIGDSMNDLSMILAAGCGVVMGNGRQEVKDAADYITAGNDEDGVAKFIEEKVLA